MASKKQIVANRRNSAKSSGPRSDQGKQITRTNALKFGLRAESLILPGEDPEEFEALFQSLAEYYHPVGTAECLQLEKVVRYEWRLQRLNRIETAILRREHFAIELERAKEGMDRAREAVEGHDEDFIKLVRLVPLDEEELALAGKDDPTSSYTIEVRNYHKWEKAHQSACDEAENDSKRTGCSMAVAFMHSSKDLETLSRYETTIERRWRSAVQDLERLQAARISKAAHTAKVIDVTDQNQNSG